MDIKTILEGILWNLKNIGRFCLIGCEEANEKEINKTYKNALIEVINMQNELYEIMQSLGLVQQKVTQETLVQRVKNSYPNVLEE